MAASNIDEVIARLDEIVARSRSDSSRLGYFAALYRKVTVKVKDGIAAGFFEDGPRMERLDVIFANRYLAAYEQQRSGAAPSAAWAYAFEVADQRWPIVLQHLLLGMNAHINLDLGIAAAKTQPADRLGGLRGDFDKINEILAGLVGDVQNELARIWSVLRLMNRYLGSVETAIINFSMEKARDRAWSVAERVAPLDGARREAAIADLDREVALLGLVIRHPGIIGSSVMKTIRLGERGSVVRKIDILS